MKGKLFLITGYSGAGKSTLVSGVCARLSRADQFTTVTTRPPRQGEALSPEYHHVDKPTYEIMRVRSEVWDHGEMDGHYFGQDIDWGRKFLASGKNLLRVVGPDTRVINRVASHFPHDAVLIWVDTSLEVANSRLRDSLDETRRKRSTNDALQNSTNGKKIKAMADYVFEPVNVIDEDINRFERLITSIIEKER